jgi:hypothetical protein
MKLKHTAAALALPALALSAFGVQAQDTVVKIGHSGPLSGAQSFSARTTKAARAWRWKS